LAREELMRISINDLARKIQDRPEIPPFHFPSWDYLYMRDLKKTEKWVADFLLAFEEFKIGLREKLREAQNDPSRFSAVEILKEILGE
jgi:hypothetical protein